MCACVCTRVELGHARDCVQRRIGSRETWAFVYSAVKKVNAEVEAEQWLSIVSLSINVDLEDGCGEETWVSASQAVAAKANGHSPGGISFGSATV